MRMNTTQNSSDRGCTKTSFNISMLRDISKAQETTTLPSASMERQNSTAQQFKPEAPRHQYLDNSKSQALGTPLRGNFKPLLLEKLVNDSLEQDKAESKLTILRDSERSHGMGSYTEAAELADCYLTYAKVTVDKILENFLAKTRSR
jgi:hypothetical protein